MDKFSISGCEFEKYSDEEARTLIAEWAASKATPNQLALAVSHIRRGVHVAVRFGRDGEESQMMVNGEMSPVYRYEQPF